MKPDWVVCQRCQVTFVDVLPGMKDRPAMICEVPGCNRRQWSGQSNRGKDGKLVLIMYTEIPDDIEVWLDQ